MLIFIVIIKYVPGQTWEYRFSLFKMYVRVLYPNTNPPKIYTSMICVIAYLHDKDFYSN